MSSRDTNYVLTVECSPPLFLFPLPIRLKRLQECVEAGFVDMKPFSLESRRHKMSWSWSEHSTFLPRCIIFGSLVTMSFFAHPS